MRSRTALSVSSISVVCACVCARRAYGECACVWLQIAQNHFKLHKNASNTRKALQRQRKAVWLGVNVLILMSMVCHLYWFLDVDFS